MLQTMPDTLIAQLMLTNVIYYLFIWYYNEWENLQICNPNIIFEKVSNQKISEDDMIKNKNSLYGVKH